MPICNFYFFNSLQLKGADLVKWFKSFKVFINLHSNVNS